MSTSPPVKTSQTAPATTEAKPQRNPTIEDFNFPADLPTAADLPDSDDQPVDSELQELIPGILKAILLDHWRGRTGWLFVIDMAFHFDPAQPCIAPDGLLSLGVKDPVDENLRSSYVLWEEKVIPILALEVVSKTPGQEHTDKLDIYQSIGILYYIVYAPLLKRKAKFQLYKLVNGKYVLESDGQQPYWMPEIGLGIGPERGVYGERDREWLYWYDRDGQRYPTPTERAEAASQKAENEAAARKLAEQKADRLLAQLRELGIDPEDT
jgi:Putative restriction endonuclease